MKIVLLPLDERPCNLLFPQQLFSHGDVEIIAPEELGNKKTPASYEKLVAFLERECATADGLVISMDMLLYGGLIPSRLHNLDKAQLLRRLDVLKRIRQAHKELPIYAFQVIMRCPDYSSSDEEPDYYAQYGKQIHDLGVAVHTARLGMDQAFSVGKMLEQVDPASLEDYIGRREINRYMNVESLHLLKDGVLDALVIPQDDAARYGYAALDQKSIREKIAEYKMDEKVLIYAGADEVGLTLLSRMLLRLNGKRPKIAARYMSELSKTIIPLYEGSTLSNTVKYHIMSAGGRITENPENADITIYLTSPSEKMEEAVSQPSEKPEYCVERNIPEMFDVLQECIQENRIITIADNGYANGGDLGLVRMLDRSGMLMQVDGYAGWNTSANTLGTAIAEAVDSYLYGKTPEHMNFLAERYLEDAGYCSVVRWSVAGALPEGMDYFDIQEPEGLVADMVRDGLHKYVAEQLPSIQDKLTIDHVSMPWRRMFEVHLEVSYHD